jgi:hypothetical protein
MRAQYLLSIFLLIASLLVVSPASVLSQSQSVVGGGGLPTEAVGGASLIFRKPQNPASLL